MQAYSDGMADIRERNGSLFAVSPMLTAKSLEFREKNNLDIDLLSDIGNAYGKKLGLVYELPMDVISTYKGAGLDFEPFNGDASWELPITAVFAVNRQGIVTYAWKETDYTRRPELEDITSGMFSSS